MTTTLTSIETFSAPFNLSPLETVAIIHAHPDDEHTTVAAADAITQLGAKLISIIATAGEASSRGNPSFVRSGGRMQENREVWQELGVPVDQQIALRLPDSGLHLPHNRVRLEFALATHIVRHNVTTIITPGAEGFDGHTDHQAIHQATLNAVERLRKRRESAEVSVWGLTHEAPDVKLPVDTNRVLGVLALNRSQFRIIPAATDIPTPHGWQRKGNFFLSGATAKILEPYETFIDSHEGYRQYA